EDPDSVSEEMQILFETILQNEGHISSPQTCGSNSKLENIIKCVMDIRTCGHLVAVVYSVYPPEVKNKPDFSFESYGFTEEDVKNVDVETISPYLVDTFDNALDALNHLKETYTSPLSFEFSHINNEEEREWFKE